jgi:WD40 repeat protein
LWDATQGEKLAVFPGRAAHVPFSVDGNRLAINTSTSSVMVWEVALQKPLRNFSLEDGTLIDSVLSPDGTRLVTLAGTGFARRHERFAILWDVDGARELARTNGATVAAFSPDAALVAFGGMDGTAHILNAATGEEETVISHEGEVLTLDFSPDGDLLATGGSDGTVRIWDRANAQEMAMLEHEAEVQVVAFNSDGTQLITRDSDGKIYKWLVNVGDLAALACNILTRNFTEEEWNTYIGSEKSYHKSCPDLPDPEEAPAP